MRWEYSPYGQPVAAIGSLEDCKAAAIAENKQHPNYPLRPINGYQFGDIAEVFIEPSKRRKHSGLYVGKLSVTCLKTENERT